MTDTPQFSRVDVIDGYCELITKSREYMKSNPTIKEKLGGYGIIYDQLVDNSFDINKFRQELVDGKSKLNLTTIQQIYTNFGNVVLPEAEFNKPATQGLIKLPLDAAHVSGLTTQDAQSVTANGAKQIAHSLAGMIGSTPQEVAEYEQMFGTFFDSAGGAVGGGLSLVKGLMSGAPKGGMLIAGALAAFQCFKNGGPLSIGGIGSGLFTFAIVGIIASLIFGSHSGAQEMDFGARGNTHVKGGHVVTDAPHGHPAPPPVQGGFRPDRGPAPAY